MNKQTGIFEIFEYDTWGNAKEGFDVNNVFRVAEEICVVDYNDMDNKSLVKAVCKAGDCYIDYRKHEVVDCWPFLEIEMKNGMPIGRIECVKEL